MNESVSEETGPEQHLILWSCTYLGYNQTQEKPMGGHVKQVSSMGTQDFVFPSQLDYNQPIVS